MSAYHVKTAPVVFDVQNSTLFGHGLLGDCYSEIISTAVTVIFSSLYQPLFLSVIGSIIVGLCGLAPLFILPVDDTLSLKTGPGGKFLRLMLSFSAGGMLGDVFLHVLPEVWKSVMVWREKEILHKVWGETWWNGGFILFGLVLFIITEKFINIFQQQTNETIKEKVATDVNLVNNNKDVGKGSKSIKGILDKQTNHIQASGYLNLVANFIDNFTHGLTIGGSFLISPRSGCFSTFAILVHEIPHEVGDFAILLKSGFGPWEAARAQLYTATAGIIGALTANLTSGFLGDVEAKISWIMPFTAGGFLHISLCTVLPELLLEENPRESIKQFSLIIVGILVMFITTHFLE